MMTEYGLELRDSEEQHYIIRYDTNELYPGDIYALAHSVLFLGHDLSADQPENLHPPLVPPGTLFVYTGSHRFEICTFSGSEEYGLQLEDARAFMTILEIAKDRELKTCDSCILRMIWEDL